MVSRSGNCVEVYLDIETTGLSPWVNEITVVGIHLCNGDETSFIQLIGEDVTTDNILGALKNASVIYTYNGSRFDLPFIYCRLGVNLAKLFTHCDLMYDCWRNNLYGGFKAVEFQLGIRRQLKGVDGWEAVKLWWEYKNNGDQDALAMLLKYNAEDVINLKALKELLGLTGSKSSDIA